MQLTKRFTRKESLLRALARTAFFVCALGSHVLIAPAAAQGLIRIEGTIVDQTGASVSDAEIELHGAMFEVVRRSSSDGRFVFEEVPVRAGSLRVRARGFASYQERWEASTSVLNIRIVLAPAPVEDEVTVRATRTETSLGETAASVRVLSTNDLDATAALTLDDGLRQVPGFNLFRRASSRTANPTAQGVSLRGTGASGASRALVLADGVPLNDPFGGWIYWGRIPRASVNRVEVLRGGASDLYGSAALGGVISIFTHDAARNSPTLSLQTSYGNAQTGDASVFASARWRENWNVSVAAEMFRTDGYIIVDEQERGRIDTPAASRRAGLEFTLGRNFGEHGRMFARASYFDESRANGTPLQTNSTIIRQFVLGGDWQTASAGAFSARVYGGTQGFDQSFSAVTQDRNSENLTRTQRVPVEFGGLTSQASRAFGARHTIVAGLDARVVRGRSDEQIFTAGRLASFVSAGGRERTIGVFAQDIFRVTNRLILTGAARVDRWKNDDAREETGSLSQNGTIIFRRFPNRVETAFSPRASLLYSLTDNVSVVAAVSRAFRAPTLNELYRSFRVGNVFTSANADLRAERATTGETGANLTAFGRRFSARGTLFWTEITRPIANVTLAETPQLITRQRQNLGRTRTRGFEFETQMRISQTWQISGGYLFADARVVEFPANLALENLFIPQVARHQFTVQARYANPSFVNVSVQARSASAQFDDDQNRFRLKGFFTLDALVSRPLARGVEAFAAFENLTNARIEIGRTPVTTIGQPFSARVGVRLRLGQQ